MLAPVFYAASIYMVLGRLIRSVSGERFSVIRTTRMTKIFVAGDILALNVQGNAAEASPNVPWRQGLRMLYACSALIIVRSTFRIAEYIMGPDGYLLSHEWPMYTFDATLMFGAQVVYFLWFPDKFQSRRADDQSTMMRLVSNNH